MERTLVPHLSCYLDKPITYLDKPKKRENKLEQT